MFHSKSVSFIVAFKSFMKSLKSLSSSLKSNLKSFRSEPPALILCSKHPGAMKMKKSN